MVQSWGLVAFKVHQIIYLFIFISWRKKSPKLWKLAPLKNDVLRKRTLHIFGKPLLPKLMNNHKSQSISFKTLNKKKSFFFLQISNVIAEHTKIDLALLGNNIPETFSKWLKMMTNCVNAQKKHWKVTTFYPKKIKIENLFFKL